MSLFCFDFIYGEAKSHKVFPFSMVLVQEYIQHFSTLFPLIIKYYVSKNFIMQRFQRFCCLTSRVLLDCMSVPWQRQMSDNLSVMQTQTVHLCSKLANGTPILKPHRPIGTLGPRRKYPSKTCHRNLSEWMFINSQSCDVLQISFCKSYPQVEFQQQQW